MDSHQNQGFYMAEGRLLWRPCLLQGRQLWSQGPTPPSLLCLLALGSWYAAAENASTASGCHKKLARMLLLSIPRRIKAAFKLIKDQRSGQLRALRGGREELGMCRLTATLQNRADERS